MYTDLLTVCSHCIIVLLQLRIVRCFLAIDYHCLKSVKIRSFFCSAFSRIRNEYGEIRSISPHSVPMRENADQKKLRIWTLFMQSIPSILSWILFIIYYLEFYQGPSRQGINHLVRTQNFSKRFAYILNGWTPRKQFHNCEFTIM